MKFAALPILLFLAMFAAAQNTTYVQTTRTCQLLVCDNAQFNPAATLSYAIPNCRVMGCSFQNSYATWNGVQYNDFAGKMVWLGYGNHYPYGTWRIQGTFDAGAYSVAEDFECYRSCGLHSNVSGTVTGP